MGRLILRVIRKFEEVIGKATAVVTAVITATVIVVVVIVAVGRAIVGTGVGILAIFTGTPVNPRRCGDARETTVGDGVVASTHVCRRTAGVAHKGKPNQVIGHGVVHNARVSSSP